MIISRTPFRISFFGGGTDYPAWYRENGGAVLATTINKYCYITCRYLPPFFENKHRIVYSEIEKIQEIEEIRHPSVRETLRFLKISEGLEIHHDADLPARTGLGSSSTFTVGLLNALFALKGLHSSPRQLAFEAIHIEQNMIKENVGSQDQTLAAYGGFNRIDFTSEHDYLHIDVTPMMLKPRRLKALQNHLMLFFTGFSHTSSQIAGEIIKEIPQKKKELTEMYQMVELAVSILNNGDLTNFGKLLHEAWQLKRSLANGISTSYIDYLYEKALQHGAIGGKLLGAGGGGFLLLFVDPEYQEEVKRSLGLLYVPFEFENSGSQIIFDEHAPYPMDKI